MQKGAEVADLERKFAEFADLCSRFSREIAEAASLFSTKDPAENVQRNLQIARTIFGKWSVDIMALLYTKREVGFQDMRKALGPISSRVLSSKLGGLQELGLIQREVLGTKPPRVQYSLTPKGRRVAKLGEPVFLYLRMTENLLVPAEPEAVAARR